MSDAIPDVKTFPFCGFPHVAGQPDVQLQVTMAMSIADLEHLVQLGNTTLRSSIIKGWLDRVGLTSSNVSIWRQRKPTNQITAERMMVYQKFSSIQALTR